MKILIIILLSFSTNAQVIFKKDKLTYEQIFSLHDEARIFASQGEYFKAISNWSIVSNFFLHRNTYNDLALTYNNIGNAYLKMGHYVLAVKFLKEAYLISLKTEKVEQKNKYLLDIVNLYKKLFLYYEAKSLINEILVKKVESSHEILLIDQSNVLRNRIEEISSHTSSGQLLTILGNSSNKLENILNLAQNYLILAEYSKVDSFLSIASQNFSKMDDKPYLQFILISSGLEVALRLNDLGLTKEISYNNKEEKNCFQVTNIYRNSLGRYVIKIAGGIQDGLYLGAKGILGSYNSDSNISTYPQNYNSIIVKSIKQFSADLEFECDYKSDTIEVSNSIFAILPSKNKTITANTILQNFGTVNFNLLNNNGELIINSFVIKRYLTTEVYDIFLEVFKAEMMEGISRFSKNDNDNVQLYEEIESGLVKGKNLISGMSETNEYLTNAFLDYLSENKDLFYNDFNFATVLFGNWLSSQTPLSSFFLFNEINENYLIIPPKLFFEKHKKTFNSEDSPVFLTEILIDSIYLNPQLDEFHMKKVEYLYNTIQQGSNNLNSALISYKIGEMYYKIKEYSKAESYFTYAKNSFTTAGYNLKRSECEVFIGLSQFNRADYIAALETFQTAINTTNRYYDFDYSCDLNYNLATAFEFIGYSNQLTGNPRKATIFLKNSLYYFETLCDSNRYKMFAVMNEIGKNYIRMGQLSDASRYYDSLYANFSESYTREISPNILIGYGDLLVKIKDYSRALQIYNIAYENLILRRDALLAGSIMAKKHLIFYEKKDFDSIPEFTKDSFSYHENSFDLVRYAYYLFEMGDFFLNKGLLDDAEYYLINANRIFEREDLQLGKEKCYKNLIKYYLKTNLTEEAVKYSNKLIKYITDSRQIIDLAETYIVLSEFYLNSFEYMIAEQYLLDALRIQEIYKLKGIKILSYFYLSKIHQLFYGEREKAIDYAHKSLREAKNEDSKVFIALSLRNLGVLYNEYGEYNIGTSYLDSAVSIEIYVGDSSIIIKANITFANILIENGKFAEADSLLTSLYLDVINQHNNFLHNSLLGSLANLCVIQGQYEKADNLYISILNRLSQGNNDIDYAWTLIHQGELYEEMGLYNKALKNYFNADSLYKKYGLQYGRIRTIYRIASIFIIKGLAREADEYFKYALKLIDEYEVKNDLAQHIKIEYASLLLKTDNTENVEEMLLNVSTSIDSKNRVLLINFLVVSFDYSIFIEDYGKTEKILKELSEEIQILENFRYDILRLMKNGEYKFHSKRYEEALVLLDSAIILSKNHNLSHHTIESIYLKARLLNLVNKDDEAISVLTGGIEILEEIFDKNYVNDTEKEKYFTGKIVKQMFELIIRLYIKKENYEKAFEYLTRSNNAELVSKIALNRKENEYNTEYGSTDIVVKLKAKIAGFEKQIYKYSIENNVKYQKVVLAIKEQKDIAEKEYLNYLIIKTKEDPTISRHYSYNVNPRSFLRYKKDIPDSLAILSYLLSDNDVTVFVATSDTIIAKIVPIPKGIIENSISRVFSNLKNTTLAKNYNLLNLQDDDTTNHQTKQYTSYFESIDLLSKVLINPINEFIENKRILCIIPNGRLFLLPFEILSSDPSIPNNLLINQYSIFYSNNLDFLKKTEFSLDTRLMAIGNSDNTLPFAEIEVFGVKEIFPESTIYTGSDASEDKVKYMTMDYSILHLAVHGELDYSNIENSYILLAPNKDLGEDGRLTINEIWQLKNICNLSLVTLSLCNSAIVDEYYRDIMVNPANAFFDVGVKTVIASLWQVDDEATSILMNAFYKNLKTMNKVMALQEAKRVLQQNPKFVFPYYWASFVMVGDYK